MYKHHSLVFFSCVSPVHMGSGTAVGAVDNPIQREVHSGHPVFAGSGIKGALRHFAASDPALADRVNVIFSPDTNASDHAGAASFSDAQLLLFPVRSLKNAYAYVTSPVAIARLLRLARFVGVEPPPLALSALEDFRCIPSSSSLSHQNAVVLEQFSFTVESSDTRAEKLAEWIARNALPGGDDWVFFRNKIIKDTVIVPDTQFNHFVEYGTVVEPHVRIDDDSGTAAEGALFYTENLPPESLLIGSVSCSDSRVDTSPLTAANIADMLREALDGRVVQIGGDATTGRGLVALRVLTA